MNPSRLRARTCAVALFTTASALFAPGNPAQAPRLIVDARPGVQGSMSSTIYTVTPSLRAGEVFLVLDDVPHGTELWRSDR